MQIFLNILFLIIGMALLIEGANFFVKGASAVASRLNVPSIFIGLTVVAVGTSLPELSVSITSAISNNIDMSVGNVVGANMLNLLFTLGIIALTSSVTIHKSSKRIDFPFLLAITTALTLFSLDVILDGANKNILSRIESIVLLLLLILYMSILIFNANRNRKREKKQELYYQQLNIFEQDTKENIKPLKVWQIVVYLVLGLGAVVFGGDCVTTTAEFLALKMGMSEALVGLTIVSFGTTLPEMVTSVIAAKKGENDLALGNIVGSNIINMSLILSTVGLIAQAPISSIILTDLIILLISTVVFTIICYRKQKIGKIEGLIFVLMYIAYLTFAIVRNYAF